MFISLAIVQFGSFALKSGRVTPIYIDLRKIISSPDLMRYLGRLYLRELKRLPCDRVAGLPYAGLPFAFTVSILGSYPSLYPRKEAKAYGTKKLIEGIYEKGDSVVVLDDVITDGGAKEEFIEVLRDAGLRIEHVLVVIDREEGGKESLRCIGCELHALFTLRELIDYYYACCLITKDQYDQASQYLTCR